MLRGTSSASSLGLTLLGRGLRRRILDVGGERDEVVLVGWWFCLPLCFAAGLCDVVDLKKQVFRFMV